MSRYLGIDIGTTSVKAAVVRSAYRKLVLEGLAMTPIQDGDVAAAIREASQSALGAGSPDGVATSMPGTQTTLRTVRIPEAAQRQLAEVLPFELEAQLPFDLSDAVLDWRIIEGATNDEGIAVLASVARVDDARKRVDLIKGALGIEPERLGVGAVPDGEPRAVRDRPHRDARRDDRAPRSRAQDERSALPPPRRARLRAHALARHRRAPGHGAEARARDPPLARRVPRARRHPARRDHPLRRRRVRLGRRVVPRRGARTARASLARALDRARRARRAGRAGAPALRRGARSRALAPIARRRARSAQRPARLRARLGLAPRARPGARGPRRRHRGELRVLFVHGHLRRVEGAHDARDRARERDEGRLRRGSDDGRARQRAPRRADRDAKRIRCRTPTRST